MTKAEKDRIMAMPTVATLSDNGGTEIKGVEYGIEDTLLCVTQSMTDNPRPHKLRIQYAQDSPFVVIDGSRTYLGNCLKNI